jgi:hypothetical protein
MQSAGQFVHVFLFRCPACCSPSASFCASSESNLETADDRVFPHRCACGWTGDLIGFMAVRHWVAAWESPRALAATADCSVRAHEAA